MIVAALLSRAKPLPWIAEPVLTPEQKQAAQLRDDAIGACEHELWNACEEGLNAAKPLDPDGEIDPRVIAARRFIHAAKAMDAAARRNKP
jgi:hypothetical protein